MTNQSGNPRRQGSATVCFALTRTTEAKLDFPMVEGFHNFSVGLRNWLEAEDSSAGPRHLTDS